jgi:hypothetical protein
MCRSGQCLGRCLSELDDAVMEDAWYELEGAYEVYGIGRYRFVMPHCRTAMLIALALLAKKKWRPMSGIRIDRLLNDLGMPEKLIGHCLRIEGKGRIRAAIRRDLDDPETSATALRETLEAFEWIRAEIEAQ